jgi:two-component system chemotaxis sensor kinase CheA
MTNGDNAFSELIQDYIVECLPLAEQAADGFLQLEARWGAGDLTDDRLETLKALLHTVKGNSAMMGLPAMQQVAHSLEDLCSLAGIKPEFRTRQVADLAAQGSSLLCELIRAAAANRGHGDLAIGFTTQVTKLVAIPETTTGAAAASDQRQGERRGGTAPAAADNVVRVDFRRLDAMLEILGEGLVEGAAVRESYQRLARRVGGATELAELDRTITALQKTLRRLEAALMNVRLLPLRTVVGRFPRLVRDLARSERKSARLVITGVDTTLDKAILDQLGQPLVHLLSNAIVHGVETPEERERLGKPAEATLELNATPIANRVLIRVSDDGRGLDEKKILAKAAAMGIGLRTAGPEQLQSLIFFPGLTTAEQVSSLAGRGIGLDVVATSIHALGGTIAVENRPGYGVTFVLSLPLTVAVMRSLIIEVDRERYALPLDHVAETVRTDTEPLHRMNQHDVAVWRGEVIHVADAGRLLGLHGHPSPRRFCIVLSSGTRQRGILVDRLIGHQDIVVKSLDPSLGRPGVISGTTILGDGRVACILDPLRILEHKVPA